ncbi:MAG: phosphoribosylformylglycinamidine synthase subunit PurQ [Hyphomicrobiales bacterium]
MKSAIIVFPGSNRERDIASALHSVFATPPLFVWHGERTVPDVDLVVLPGGFSYGDYLRCGAIAAHSPIMADVVGKANSGVLVLGICNGFQILTEIGLLPGLLMRNASLRFVCRLVHLRIDNNETAYTRGYGPNKVIRCPVAHGDGNYFADEETLDRLEGEGRVALRYCDANGALSARANPNGSQRNIAGILNETGNVLGLMPHPENFMKPLHGGADCRVFFENMASSLQMA